MGTARTWLAGRLMVMAGSFRCGPVLVRGRRCGLAPALSAGDAHRLPAGHRQRAVAVAREVRLLLAGLVQRRTNGLLWMMDTIWAPWLMREATHCSVWPASGPPGPPLGMGTATVWVHW